MKNKFDTQGNDYLQNMSTNFTDYTKVFRRRKTQIRAIPARLVPVRQGCNSLIKNQNIG